MHQLFSFLDYLSVINRLLILAYFEKVLYLKLGLLLIQHIFIYK